MPDFIYIFALILLIVLCIPKYEPFSSNISEKIVPTALSY